MGKEKFQGLKKRGPFENDFGIDIRIRGKSTVEGGKIWKNAFFTTKRIFDDNVQFSQYLSKIISNCLFECYLSYFTLNSSNFIRKNTTFVIYSLKNGFE